VLHPKRLRSGELSDVFLVYTKYCVSVQFAGKYEYDNAVGDRRLHGANPVLWFAAR
jgi:hypothetical protein